MDEHIWLRRGRSGIAAAGLAVLFSCAVACSSDDSDDFPTPDGFSGTGGLIGSSGVGSRAPVKAGNGGKGGSASGGNGGSSRPELPGGTCANAVADTAPVTPTIWLVVDGSSSMNNNFEGGRTRWQTLRSTLMDPDGIVETLQATVRFGLVIYAGSGTDPAQCVQLIAVEPAFNSHAAIAARYPMDPVASGTPTDRALDHVVKNLPVTNSAAPDRMSGPVYVVLATDGQPNIGCGDLSGGSDRMVEQRVVDITREGTEAGMRMYVVSLAGGDRNLQSHLQDVAMATESKTPPFVPSTRGDLVSTFQRIVGGASCEIELKGRVDEGAACSGKVTLNGKDLACNSDDGWRLVDEDTFQLVGNACTSFLSSASTVHAMFPCEVFRPD